MGNIDKILKGKLNENETIQKESLNSTIVIDFFDQLISNVLLNNIEESLEQLFELNIYETGKTKENILNEDRELFLKYLFLIQNTEKEFVFKNMYNILCNKKSEIDLCFKKNASHFNSLIENFQTKIKYFEELEIIKNRLNFFCSSDILFPKNNFPSCRDDMKKEKDKEVKKIFDNEKIMLKSINEKNIKEIAKLRKLYTIEEVDIMLENNSKLILEQFEKKIKERIKENVTKEFIEELLKPEEQAPKE